jgi:hypothetical protein
MPVSANKYGTPTTSGPEPIRGYQAAANRVVRGMLATPGLRGLAGKRLLNIVVTGRKSGRRIVVPVAYTQHGGAILVGTNSRNLWLRNLVAGEPVELQIAGRTVHADHVLHTDEEPVMRLYRVVAEDNHANAKFNGVGIDAQGKAIDADLYQSWSLGAAVLQLTPR